MDSLSGGALLALYLLTVVCGVTLVAVLFASKRARKNAGFASKAALKRQLSARAATQATEIRPSLTRGIHGTTRAPAVSLAKNRSAGS